MLADQIALSATEVNGLTIRTLEAEKAYDFNEATHYDRRRDRATRRMHESIKLMHVIRTKAAPALQVNVQQNLTVASSESEKQSIIDIRETRAIEETG
jgi:hypothetical protein